MNHEDITIEFYYKKATYKNPITGTSYEVIIKKVVRYLLSGSIGIESDKGIYYSTEELTDFSI